MNEEPKLEFPRPEAPTNVEVKPVAKPKALESIGQPDDHEAKIALAALKAGDPLQSGVPGDAKVEDFKSKK